MPLESDKNENDRMAESTNHRARQYTVAGCLCLLLALAFVLVISIWGAWRNISDGRAATLRAEITRLRSHAVRTVGRIENLLESQPDPPALDSLREAEWLRDFWSKVLPREGQRLYAALVKDDGTIVMHSDKRQQGRKLEGRWFENSVFEAGPDVVKTRSSTLASGQLAYDIRVPIEVRGHEIGAYHSGFAAAWLEDILAAREAVIYTRWALIGGLIGLVVLGAGASLFYLARRTAALHQELGLARTQQLAELGRLAGALAHEIRNPLNAVRLNLHALTRYLANEYSMSCEEVSRIITESNTEIERLDTLIRSILGYARPDQAKLEDVDLGTELEATVGFLGQLLGRNDIHVGMELSESAVVVRMDRDRLRQMMLNLLNNAHEAVGSGGDITVRLESKEGWAEISVADTGPGVAPDACERIFQPFFTTKDSGCGLGLALVKRFAEDAGGTVSCDSNGQRGAQFTVRLPEKIGRQQSREW